MQVYVLSGVLPTIRPHAQWTTKFTNVMSRTGQHVRDDHLVVSGKTKLSLGIIITGARVTRPGEVEISFLNTAPVHVQGRGYLVFLLGFTEPEAAQAGAPAPDLVNEQKHLTPPPADDCAK